ncbi:ATP-binding protein [Streptomyces sp. NPDC054847]
MASICSAATPTIETVIEGEWSRHFYLLAEVAGLTRIHTRTRLTMLRWAGNVEAATTVAAILVQNSVDHANPGRFCDRSSTGLRLAITEAGGLLIDVSDPLPAFPGFAAAAAGARGRGPWHATRLGARFSWFLTADGDRNTVRAHMLPGQVPA